MKIPAFLQPTLTKLLTEGKKYWKQLRKNYIEFSQKNSRLNENIQLTFIYFFALVDLLHSILNNVFSLGYFPEMIKAFLPFIESILLSPFFQIWASPEKVFFLSYVVIELMIIRSVFGFSKLIKYNILLIFALLMLQSLAISYWDILFHREIAITASKWAYDKGAIIFTDKDTAITFFFTTFFVFVVGYILLYFRALQGKFPVLPTMEWLTDSIAFWIRIKTPTMRVGKRKQSKEQKKEDDEKDDLFDDIEDDEKPEDE
jgi:hypothetical protein